MALVPTAAADAWQLLTMVSSLWREADAMDGCIFCGVADGEVAAHVVVDDPEVIAFHDHRPLFPGHVLVIPRRHIPTLIELDETLLTPLFVVARRVAAAMGPALGADGTFVAINNVVSQSVPHLHIHVVPRRRRDGLRGFFWPRQRYENEAAAVDVATRLRLNLGADEGKTG
jgi:histidine triad (HIT) family protein